MHTVAVLEQALNVARQLGYRIRHEWLDGRGAGECEFNGKRWLFVDLAKSPDEQLCEIVRVLTQRPELETVPLPTGLRQLLDHRRNAA